MRLASTCKCHGQQVLLSTAGASVDQGLGLGQEAGMEGGRAVCRGVPRNQGAPGRRAGMAGGAFALQHSLCCRVIYGQVCICDTLME